VEGRLIRDVGRGEKRSSRIEGGGRAGREVGRQKRKGELERSRIREGKQMILVKVREGENGTN